MNDVRITIYADFCNCDVHGRIRLTTNGTLKDLEKLGEELKEGMPVHLSDGELEGDGVVTYSDDEKIWVAVVHWSDVQQIAPL